MDYLCCYGYSEFAGSEYEMYEANEEEVIEISSDSEEVIEISSDSEEEKVIKKQKVEEEEEEEKVAKVKKILTYDEIKLKELTKDFNKEVKRKYKGTKSFKTCLNVVKGMLPRKQSGLIKVQIKKYTYKEWDAVETLFIVFQAEYDSDDEDDKKLDQRLIDSICNIGEFKLKGKVSNASKTIKELKDDLVSCLYKYNECSRLRDKYPEYREDYNKELEEESIKLINATVNFYQILFIL
jgi:hypothetical protein